MATIQIEVINVSEPKVTKTTRGQYSSIEVAYKKDGKVEGKKLMSFASAEVYEAARTWESGQVVNIEIGKDDKGYWQWQKVLGEANHSVVAGNEATPVKSGGKTVSNYETREERQQRQQFIIRQSSLERAVEYFTLTGHKKATPEDIKSLAEVFVDYVNGTDSATPVAARIGAFDNFEDDIPQ